MHTIKTIALLAATAASAFAYNVTISNFDFETDGFDFDAFTNNPGVIPTGWTAIGSFTGAFYGYFNPDNVAFDDTDGSGVGVNMSGPNIFYFGSAVTGEGIQQTLSESFAADTDYALTVALGAREGNIAFTASLDVVLLAGATIIASDTFRNTSNDGTFADYTLNYSYNGAHAGLIGQALTIQFIENDSVATGEVDIDNVRLTAIPEPSAAAALAGLAVLGLAANRRRRAA